jgi:hypothetical protein
LDTRSSQKMREKTEIARIVTLICLSVKREESSISIGEPKRAEGSFGNGRSLFQGANFCYQFFSG